MLARLQPDWAEIAHFDNLDGLSYTDCSEKLDCAIISRAGIVELWKFDSEHKVFLGPGSLGKIDSRGACVVYRDTQVLEQCVVYSITSSEQVAVLRHTDEVLCISIRDNCIATASHDKTVKLWSYEGELMLDIVHETSVLTVAMSRHFVATGSTDHVVRLFHKEKGSLLAEFPAHEDRVTCLAIVEESAVNTLVLSGSWDMTLRVWEREATGHRLRWSIVHPALVSALAVSADNRFVSTGACDYITRLFRITSGALVSRVTGHRRWVESVCLSRDGSFAITSSKDCSVKKFDLFFADRARLVALSRCLRQIRTVPIPEDILRIVKRMLI